MFHQNRNGGQLLEYLIAVTSQNQNKDIATQNNKHHLVQLALNIIYKERNDIDNKIQVPPCDVSFS